MFHRFQFLMSDLKYVLCCASQDLAALDFESMQLPPMDPTAKPSTSRYSLHFLLTSPETLPPVSEFCPRQVLKGMCRDNQFFFMNVHVAESQW